MIKQCLLSVFLMLAGVVGVYGVCLVIITVACPNKSCNTPQESLTK